MRNIYKFYITWIIGLMFYPIGLYWIQVYNNPILTIVSFLISGMILIFMLNYIRKIRVD